MRGPYCIFEDDMAHHDLPDMGRLAVSAYHDTCPDAEIFASTETFGEATHTLSIQSGIM